MKRLATTIALGLAFVSAGCGDTTNTPDMSVQQVDMAMAAFPAAPTIGATTLDRMGRAAINTALTDPFYTDSTMHGMSLDAYNKAPRSMWSTFAKQFATALAVLDGLDGVCGNQPLFNSGNPDGGATGGYGMLATILTDDELLLDTAVATCDPTKNYLAVEVGVITGGTPASCGGRTPLDPAINVTYAVVSGALGTSVTVTDGVSRDGDPAANAATLTTFPYLGPPQ
jgi:hypothetical protein